MSHLLTSDGWPILVACPWGVKADCDPRPAFGRASLVACLPSIQFNDEYKQHEEEQPKKPLLPKLGG
jgi:hypothetical protein